MFGKISMKILKNLNLSIFGGSSVHFPRHTNLGKQNNFERFLSYLLSIIHINSTFVLKKKKNGQRFDTKMGLHSSMSHKFAHSQRHTVTLSLCHMAEI